MNIDKIIHKLQYLPEKVEISGNAIAVSQFFEAMAAGADLLKKLKEYQQLEADGRLVKLPYKLGTETIYYIDKAHIYELDATKIELEIMPISKKILFTIDCCEFIEEDFGELVFLTKAEAEAKLAELRCTE